MSTSGSSVISPISGIYSESGGYETEFRTTLRKEKGMPGKKPLRGVGEKEQRQYEHIKENAEKTGRYRGRAKEVAARTVLKQHQEKGHEAGQ